MSDTPSSEDAALAAQLQNFDPIYDAPSAVKVVGNVQLPEPKITMFDQATQDRINAKLANVTPGNRDLFEREFIREELEANSRKVRLMTGLGDDATETQRATLNIANRVRLLQNDIANAQGRLDEPMVVNDPVTGQPVPLKTKRLQGDGRTALQHQINEWNRQIALLRGVEGDREIEEATRADIKRIREQEQSLADLAEARKRADANKREERIERMADTFARNSRSNLG
jgi:hypothetical protein